MKAIFKETENMKGGEFDLTPADLADNAEFIRAAAKDGIMTVIDGATVIFPDNPGIYKPGDIVNSASISAVDGECFLSWIVDESTSRKGTRIYDGKKKIAVVEYLALALEYKELAAARDSAAAAAKIEGEILADYFSALPAEIRGLYRSGRELEDRYGNYLFTLPKKAALEGWSVKQLESWIAAADRSE